MTDIIPSKKSQTKFVKCYFCGKEFETYMSASTKESICSECKTKGKKSPVHIRSVTNFRNTCLKKYGVENPSKLKEVKEKKKKTCLNNYGVEYPGQSELVKEKMKNTVRKHYGSDYYLSSQDCKNRTKNTLIEKYGVDNISKTDLFKEKFKTTMLDRYNVIHPSQLLSVKEKKKRTTLDHYNVENPFQSSEIKEKIKKVNLEKYGVENPGQSKEVKDNIRKKFLEKRLPEIKKYLKYLDLQIVNENEYQNYSSKCKFKCIICGNIFVQTLIGISHGFICNNCYPRTPSTSKGEMELFEFVRLVNDTEVVNNYKAMIKPYELDIYIPNKKIAIEFNGLYWHSEKFGVGVNYHLKKTILCQERDIRLIHIFEDEWIYKKEIVQNRLKQILNINNDTKRIHARQCEIKEIDAKSKDEFLNIYHIQGSDISTIKLGAFYKNELVSIMTFSKPNISKGQKTKEEGVWELNRFCSNFNYRIPGIASKFLSYFKRNYNWNQIYSYADRRWSNGNIYYKLGFKLDHITKPNYWYTDTRIRIHRFNLRKKHDEPKDIPEYVLRLKEGYTRIWDCGNLKFVMDLNQT